MDLVSQKYDKVDIFSLYKTSGTKGVTKSRYPWWSSQVTHDVYHVATVPESGYRNLTIATLSDKDEEHKDFDVVDLQFDKNIKKYFGYLQSYYNEDVHQNRFIPLYASFKNANDFREKTKLFLIHNTLFGAKYINIADNTQFKNIFDIIKSYNDNRSKTRKILRRVKGIGTSSIAVFDGAMKTIYKMLKLCDLSKQDLLVRDNLFFMCFFLDYFSTGHKSMRDLTTSSYKKQCLKQLYDNSFWEVEKLGDCVSKRHVISGSSVYFLKDIDGVGNATISKLNNYIYDKFHRWAK